MAVLEQPVVRTGEWLLAQRQLIDGAEGDWLQALAAFDREEGWAEDGHLSCAEWLMARAGLSRPVAYERVRVARELVRRPVLVEAMGAGRLSYCALRAITRAEGADAGVDAALVQVAEAGTVVDVERAVRAYRCYQDQERAPGEAVRAPERGFRVRPLADGMARIEMVVTATEAAEIEAAVLAMINGDRSDRGGPADEVPGLGGEGTAGARMTTEGAGESPCEDWGDRSDVVTGVALPGWPELQADALMDLARAGLRAERPGAAGADRYLVHMVVRDGVAGVLGGDVLAPSEAARVLCDCSAVRHEVVGGEPLRLGRRSRVWSTAQRRATLVRDGGCCRYPGCRRTQVDLHHLVPWDDGGATDVDNAVNLCPRHHTLLHEGFVVRGDPHGTLEWFSGSGRMVGRSTAVGSGR